MSGVLLRPPVHERLLGQGSLEHHDVSVLFALERLVHQDPAELPALLAKSVKLLLKVGSFQLFFVPSHEAAREDDGLVVPFRHLAPPRVDGVILADRWTRTAASRAAGGRKIAPRVRNDPRSLIRRSRRLRRRRTRDQRARERAQRDTGGRRPSNTGRGG